MAHATNDIGAVRMFLGPAVMYSFDTVIRFSIVIYILLSISSQLTILALLPLPLLSYFVYKISTKIHKKFTRIQEKFSELTTKAQENFSGIRVIKSYVREQSEIDAFKNLSHDYLLKNMDKIKIQALFMPMLFMIMGTSIIIVIWYGGTMVMNDGITLGELTAVILYLSMLIWPTIAFGWILNIIQQASASMKRINKIWNEFVEIKDTRNTNFDIKELDGTIEFRNVSFQYNNESGTVLKDINLEIPKGKSLAVVGHTGVGKTSFVNLISRLYDVTEGEILIDGNNIKDIPLRILRKSIGMVPQETFLFSDTLANNLLYGVNGNRSEELIKQVAEIAQLSKDVEQFPDGYETELGERGITLIRRTETASLFRKCIGCRSENFNLR
jgi:ATP-binding cassette subfamily B multidrug efflux pump